MAPSPPPTGLLHQSASTAVLGAIPTRLVTEDTPPDMLAGSMDLRVTLPNGHTVKMSVERSMPMMDLLVHITTAHKVSPGGHVLQAMGERGVLPYKPSTPIGTLDTWSLRVVPRNQAGSGVLQTLSNAVKRVPPKPSVPQSSQPFEQTCRLQVRLPRNQLFVARLNPRTILADILAHVCREKRLDPEKYELRHPVNTDQPLQLSLSLADYRVTEVALVPRGSRAPTELSSSDIPALQSLNEDLHAPPGTNGQQKVSHTSSSSYSSSSGGGGVISTMLKRSRSGGNADGSLSGDSLGGRSSSPAHSEESVGRSASPPAPRPTLQAPPPVRHRKGRAPKPPPPRAVSNEKNSTRVNKCKVTDPSSSDERTLVISHSRNSSDSSGYHEASVLSESPENHTNHVGSVDSPPDQQSKHSANCKPSKTHSKEFSRTVSNHSAEASTSQAPQGSTMLATNKKKRAPAPPPPQIPVSQIIPALQEIQEAPVLPPPANGSAIEPVRPIPAPRSHLNNSPQIEKEHVTSLAAVNRTEPPPILHRRKKKGNATHVYSNPTAGCMKNTETDRPVSPSASSTGTGPILSRQSSIDSSNSSVFGVGKSLLAMGASMEVSSSSEDNSDGDDLNMDLFEGAGYSSLSNTILEEDRDSNVTFETFHDMLSARKRNSITQILHKSSQRGSRESKKAPAPKAPKPIGRRLQPKLGDLAWSSMDEIQFDPAHIPSFEGEGGRAPLPPDSTSIQPLAAASDSDFTDLAVDETQPHDSAQDTSSSESTVTTGQDDEESIGEEELDSAFQSVTDVLEEQIRAEVASAAQVATQIEEEKKLAEEERVRNEERLKAEEDRKRAQEEFKQLELEKARIAEEREELARQRREQQALEQELRERLQRELEDKQRALQEEQRREIERLQKEQEELECELREREKEKNERLMKRMKKQVTQSSCASDQVILEWEYKLPAPPSAFQDKQMDSSDMGNQSGKEECSSLGSFERNAQEVEAKNKINAMMELEKNSDEETSDHVINHEVHESHLQVDQKLPLFNVSAPTELSKSSISLFHPVQQEEIAVSVESVKPSSQLRNTSSVADLSSGAKDDDEARLQQLQQQFIQWQEQLISNQSVLQGHVSMPLQSLQVLREILPQMKQKMSETSIETTDESANARPTTLPRPPKPVETPPTATATLDRHSVSTTVSSSRYRPPTVNLGTWSDRPKSEVSLKEDNDYRIGVGQHQCTAARAPVVRSAEPKLKDTTNLISAGAKSRDLISRSNSWRSVTTSAAPLKPSMVVIQNMSSAISTEQVRASNKPTVILRQQPMSLTDTLPQKRYTTLVGVNGAPQPKASVFSTHQRNLNSSSFPTVKGFKIEVDAPPPPAPVLTNNSMVTRKTSSALSVKTSISTRDDLMDAIRNFGGRSNLRKTRSLQH